MRSLTAGPAGLRERLTKRGPNSVNPGLIVALGVIFILLSFASPFFLTVNNLLNISKAVAVVGIAAAGETIVIISGGFDLSIGSTMAAAGMLAAYLLEFGFALPLAFAGALALGVGIGAVNGTIISYFRINPLIATLATLAIVRGLAFVISGGREIVITNETWRSLGTLELLGLPFIVLVLVGTFLLIGWAMPRTIFGRYAYAIGSNARAARLSGVAVNRWRLLFYIICGLTAAIAGLVLAARTGNARPSAAMGFELDVITAVILGGASLSGGRGSIFGTLIALFLLGVVNNGLILMQVPSFWQQVVKGVILLGAVLYDEVRRGRLGRHVTVRVGVIGTGWWSTRAHLPALDADPDAEVVALADPDRDNLARAAERFGVGRIFEDAETMLAAVDLDAAVIAVPHAMHASIARACLERGLHVLLEKPMTIDPADAYDLVELAERTGQELIIGYPWHYSGQVLAVRAAIAQSRIGEIEAVSCLFASVVRELYRGRPEPYRDVLGYTLNAPRQATYRDTALSGGGQGQWQVTHAAALLQWLTGLEPVEVAAFTATMDVDMDLVDAVSVRFSNGAIGNIVSTGGVVPAQPESLEYRIFGRSGHIFFDVNGGIASLHLADGSVEEFAPLSPEQRYPEWAPARNLVEVSVRRAANGSPPRLGAQTVALVDAMYRSAADGRATLLFGVANA